VSAINFQSRSQARRRYRSAAPFGLVAPRFSPVADKLPPPPSPPPSPPIPTPPTTPEPRALTASASLIGRLSSGALSRCPRAPLTWRALRIIDPLTEGTYPPGLPTKKSPPSVPTCSTCSLRIYYSHEHPFSCILFLIVSMNALAQLGSNNAMYFHRTLHICIYNLSRRLYFLSQHTINILGIDPDAPQFLLLHANTLIGRTFIPTLSL
jgi:hypothetical protein